MLIRKVNNNVFDVFGNKGFDTWTRVRAHHHGFSVVAGQRVEPAIFRSIISAIKANPDGSINNVVSE